jgi:hypothetical protein
VRRQQLYCTTGAAPLSTLATQNETKSISPASGIPSEQKPLHSCMQYLHRAQACTRQSLGRSSARTCPSFICQSSKQERHFSRRQRTPSLCVRESITTTLVQLHVGQVFWCIFIGWYEASHAWDVLPGQLPSQPLPAAWYSAESHESTARPCSGWQVDNRAKHYPFQVAGQG